MSDHNVTLTISENVYVRARQTAESTGQSVEHCLTTWLEQIVWDFTILPPDERTELAALKGLSDDTLWTIATEKMPPLQHQRLNLLLELNKRGALTSTENSELGNLLERSNRRTLRKEEAAAILTARGYQVDPKNFAPSGK